MILEINDLKKNDFQLSKINIIHQKPVYRNFECAYRIANGFLYILHGTGRYYFKEGEFDFVLTYELDGEEKKIDGTYVCEFDGVSRAIDGVSRDWTGYIKDHDNFTEYEIKTTEEGTIKIELDISPEFFMSDPNYKLSENTDDPKPEPFVYITSGDPTIEDPANEVTFDLYKGDDVKIISFEYDEPVENIYK